MAAPNIEAEYKDLLNPIKDPEKSFDVNIAELLQKYLKELVQGKSNPNFNSAALLLQGSSSIYGKKVEYIYNLTTQLHQSLTKQTDEQHTRKEPAKEKQKEGKLSDPFFCTGIKLGKNLSCLKRKNSSKNALNKRPCKKTQLMKSVFIPIQLIALEDDEKGDVIYDTRGEAVGNKLDFVLNKCTLTSSGWLLLPNINKDLVPSDPSLTDYVEEESDKEDYCNNDDDIMLLDSGDLPSTPDNGLGTDPQTISPNSAVSSSNDHSGPASTDEGIGTVGSSQTPIVDSSENQDSENPTPSDQPEATSEEQEANAEAPIKQLPEGIENVPLDIDNDNDALRPVRQSFRKALKVCQLEHQLKVQNNTGEIVAVRKAIQKKNTQVLPAKLRTPGAAVTVLTPTPEFCARTFFSMDEKLLKSRYLRYELPAFSKNSKFFKRLVEKLEFLKSANRKNKKYNEVIGDENEDVDVMRDDDLPDTSPDFLCSPIDDADIIIENGHEKCFSRSTAAALDPKFPDEENPLAEVSPSKNLRELAQEQFDLCTKELVRFSLTTELSESAQQWEDCIVPFLEEQEKREQFDINLYGARILNAFEDNNSKQSINFRHFCKNMQKWEIHRYFMALLPLANIGNVAIEKERREDGTDEIIMTLLSRKMHHKELEEFGHNEGSHL